MSNLPLVSVVMITYNHVKYIKQAIEGVLMQEYNGKIELIIADDASPDNTESIVNQLIKEHKNGHWIKYTKHKVNKGMSENFIWALQQAKGKYIALCEGDDYWTDPYKLQKQVDFLEENEDYVLVSTQRDNFNNETKKFSYPRVITENFKTYDFKDVIISAPIATLTTLFKTELINKIAPHILTKKLNGLDYTLWLFFSYFGKIAILKDVTAVYRILPESVSHSKVNPNHKWSLKKLYYDDFIFIIKHFNIEKEKFVQKAIYHRAKYNYILAIKSKDFEFCKSISPIFKKNNDYIRYIICKNKIKTNLITSLIYFFEKISQKIRNISYVNNNS